MNKMTDTTNPTNPQNTTQPRTLADLFKGAWEKPRSYNPPAEDEDDMPSEAYLRYLDELPPPRGFSLYIEERIF